MDQPSSVNEVAANAFEAVSGNRDSKDLSLESLVLLVNTERLHHLENKITKEFVELKRRQDQVTFLHKLIKKINTA